MLAPNLLFTCLLLPFFGAFFLLFSSQRKIYVSQPLENEVISKKLNPHIQFSVILTLILTCLMGFLYFDINLDEVIRYEIPWVPSLNFSFVIRLDSISWVFSFLVLFIGFLVFSYSFYYFNDKEEISKFLALLFLFMGSMLGLVISGHLLQLVIFWEMTSITSFLLIGYYNKKAEARRGSRTAMIVTTAGGLCLLLATLLIYNILGTYDLDLILASKNTLANSPNFNLIVYLIIIGALTKSAQFPFHFWLPQAMSAPTPVSAYLHSATMVKAGIFLLMRFWPILIQAELWPWIVSGSGAITLIFGATLAVFQTDIKKILAYSTISNLGLITFLLGLATPTAFVVALFHTINHAIFKASLFMLSGVIDHECGTRDIRNLGGLYKNMPITATLSVVASAAMAGVPLLNGFLSKEMFFAETLSFKNFSFGWAVPIIATIASLLTVTYSLRWCLNVFFKNSEHTTTAITSNKLIAVSKDPIFWKTLPIQCLLIICLAIGVAPAITVAPFLKEAVYSVLLDQTPFYTLSFWHGFNLPLLMSIFAFSGGIIFYFSLKKIKGYFPNRIWFLRFLDGRIFFEKILVKITVLSGWLAAALSSRHLQAQFLMIFIVAVFVMGGLLLQGLDFDVHATPVDPAFLFLWIIGTGCALGAAQRAKYHRLVALVLLGGAGLVTTVTFAWFSAPDLALTQLMVESVTVVLLLLGLRWLPRRLLPKERPPQIRPTWSLDWHYTLRNRVQKITLAARRTRDLLISVLMGTAFAVLAYAVLTRPHLAKQGISEFFAAHALTDGGGRNIVNVILVDFRAFDTLGEMTVLGIVALTVYALLRRFRPAPESIATPIQQLEQITGNSSCPGSDAERGYLMVPGLFLRLLLPILWMVAIFFLLRGHNHPGGGFVAGLIVTLAITLQYLTGGSAWVESRLRVRPYWWIGLGLLLAVLTGAGSWLFGYPFLTSHSGYLELPLIGKLSFSSAFLFDFGVFSLVIGVTTLLLLSLAHQSLRSQRMPTSTTNKQVVTETPDDQED